MGVEGANSRAAPGSPHSSYTTGGFEIVKFIEKDLAGQTIIVFYYVLLSSCIKFWK